MARYTQTTDFLNTLTKLHQINNDVKVTKTAKKAINKNTTVEQQNQPTTRRNISRQRVRDRKRLHKRWTSHRRRTQVGNKKIERNIITIAV